MKIIFRRVVLGSTLFFFAILVCTFVLPFLFNTTDIINQTALQSVRAQRIAKDVLILAYRPVGEHAQAISEMQNTMPVWEAEQKTLQSIVNSDSHLLVNQSQPDFVAVDVAANKLLAHPGAKIDGTQVQIILDHERNYTLIMNQLSTLRQSHIQNSNILLFAVQMIAITLIIASVIVLFRLSYQPKSKENDLCPIIPVQ